MATARQIFIYRLHRQICLGLGIPQSTFKHKDLAGSLSAASATGVKVYTPPAPVNPGSLQSTTDTAMWIVWQEVTRGVSDDEPEAGRLGTGHAKGQMPVLNDPDGNGVFGAGPTVAHDDWFADMNGLLYRILNPIVSEDGSYWSFEVVRQR